jgi:hypothetical protein
MENNELIESWNNLSQTEKDILGRPNFMCGQIAQMMRAKGFDCPPKAEVEQALVIHTMLKFYDKHGEKWVDELANFLKDGK